MTQARGERMGNAVLTEPLVRRIKQLRRPAKKPSEHRAAEEMIRCRMCLVWVSN